MNSWANIKAIAKRELVAYFASPVAYVFIVIFLLLTGFFTFMLAGFLSRGRPRCIRFSCGIHGSICFWFRRRACVCGRRSGVSAQWSFC